MGFVKGNLFLRKDVKKWNSRAGFYFLNVNNKVPIVKKQ